MLVGSSY